MICGFDMAWVGPPKTQRNPRHHLRQRGLFCVVLAVATSRAPCLIAQHGIGASLANRLRCLRVCHQGAAKVRNGPL